MTLPTLGSVRITLPTTGYIIIHTVQRDGRDSYTVPTFIDCANRMDDHAATLRLLEEFDSLSKGAPSNVLHKLRLVHRTEDGDRMASAELTVRGAGDPLTN